MNLPIQLHDSRTRTKILLPTNQIINIYLCGPTLYNDLHIGNIRNIIIFDALVRFLRFQGYSVNFLQNLTDVADKISFRAREQKKTEKNIADYFYKRYLELLKNLNISEHKLIKVSEIIPQIITFVQRLEKANLTIQTEDGIYFNLSPHVQNYGVFKKIFLKTEASVLDGQKFLKENFVLWKFIPVNSISTTWNSPWGSGRPGWHTQCILLATNFEKKQAIIHGGGKDLVFPHHENERIQFLALNKSEPVKIWFHNGFINFKKTKISKSNKKNADSFLAFKWLKNYSSNVTKLWMLNQKPKLDLELNFDQLKFATNLINKFSQIFAQTQTYVFLNLKKLPSITKVNKNDLIEFTNYLADNFNTPVALNWIVEKLKKLNNLLSSKKFIEAFTWMQKLKTALHILGIEIDIPHLSTENCQLILEWDKELKQKNFKQSDKIRSLLTKKKFL